MIQHIATQAVYVTDQQKAEDFWVKKVGFEVLAKNEMGNGLYWLEVGPPKIQTRIVLYPRSIMKDWEKKNPSLVFQCDNVEKTFLDFKDKGVEMGMAPNRMPFGTFASFKDPDGNEFLMKS